MPTLAHSLARTSILPSALCLRFEPSFPKVRIPHTQSMNKKTVSDDTDFLFMVGAKGFEPSTSCSQSKHSTRLSYAPKRHRL